jgi:hypothetical protein
MEQKKKSSTIFFLPLVFAFPKSVKKDPRDEDLNGSAVRAWNFYKNFNSRHTRVEFLTGHGFFRENRRPGLFVSGKRNGNCSL